MEQKRIINAIHAAVLNRNIKNIKSIGDFYKDASGDIDISNLRLDVVNEHKEVFEWILDNPNYNFNGLFDTQFSNNELYNYFTIYYQDLLFKLDKFSKKEFFIKPSSFK